MSNENKPTEKSNSLKAGCISNWSFSRLIEFETCPYRSKLKIIDRIPEPERPLPPGKTEHANDRGSRIHLAIENYVRDQGVFPPEAESLREEIEQIKTYYAQGLVVCEEEWGFNHDWEPCDYKEAWVKLKCDYVITPEHNVVEVIDIKTGKKKYNQVKHGQQLQLYAIGAAIRYPEAEVISVKLYYTDEGVTTEEIKPVKKWLSLLPMFNHRGRAMCNETRFKPTPSVHACQWCPYKEGICEHAIDSHTEQAKKARSMMYARKKRPV